MSSSFINSALLLEDAPGRLDVDCAVLREGLASLGIPSTNYFEKHLLRGRVPLSTDTLVAGSIPAFRAALRALGRTFPNPFDYPACLARYFGRRIWATTGSEAISRGNRGPVFVKPRDRLKSFTGFVLGRDASLARVRPRDQVWCSEVIELSGETRAFVALGKILGVRPYIGVQNVDMATIGEASREFFNAGGPVSFLLDFGITSDGRTVLIEANDAFACGAYGLNSKLYALVLCLRWIELMHGKEAAVEATKPGAQLSLL